MWARCRYRLTDLAGHIVPSAGTEGSQEARAKFIATLFSLGPYDTTLSYDGWGTRLYLRLGIAGKTPQVVERDTRASNEKPAIWRVLTTRSVGRAAGRSGGMDLASRLVSRLERKSVPFGEVWQLVGSDFGAMGRCCALNHRNDRV